MVTLTTMEKKGLWSNGMRPLLSEGVKKEEALPRPLMSVFEESFHWKTQTQHTLSHIIEALQ